MPYVKKIILTEALLQMKVIITSFGEIDKNEFLDPRTAQVAIVDHIKQVICVFLIQL